MEVKNFQIAVNNSLCKSQKLIIIPEIIIDPTKFYSLKGILNIIIHSGENENIGCFDFWGTSNGSYTIKTLSRNSTFDKHITDDQLEFIINDDKFNIICNFNQQNVTVEILANIDILS